LAPAAEPQVPDIVGYLSAGLLAEPEVFPTRGKAQVAAFERGLGVFTVRKAEGGYVIDENAKPEDFKREPAPKARKAKAEKAAPAAKAPKAAKPAKARRRPGQIRRDPRGRRAGSACQARKSFNVTRPPSRRNPVQFLPKPAQTFRFPRLFGEGLFKCSHRGCEIGFKRVINVASLDPAKLPKRCSINVVAPATLGVCHPIPELSSVPFGRKIGYRDVLISICHFLLSPGSRTARSLDHLSPESRSAQCRLPSVRSPRSRKRARLGVQPSFFGRPSAFLHSSCARQSSKAEFFGVTPQVGGMAAISFGDERFWSISPSSFVRNLDASPQSLTPKS
jgi:hypothetical protein